jgi:hypothetical protein
VMDWSRLRTEALELIGRLPPGGLVVLDGRSSACAELADLVQLVIWVDADTPNKAVRPERPTEFDLRVTGANYATRALRN